ncbi:MAG: hypothetical protein M3Y17_07745 [Actinomycetota bacterium]|nr:hypothetical protein [Actinomycetota bacterium]
MDVEALARVPLAQTRRTYTSKARQYLAWLTDAETGGDALACTDGRDWASTARVGESGRR